MPGKLISAVGVSWHVHSTRLVSEAGSGLTPDRHQVDVRLHWFCQLPTNQPYHPCTPNRNNSPCAVPEGIKSMPASQVPAILQQGLLDSWWKNGYTFSIASRQQDGYQRRPFRMQNGKRLIREINVPSSGFSRRIHGANNCLGPTQPPGLFKFRTIRQGQPKLRFVPN